MYLEQIFQKDKEVEGKGEKLEGLADVVEIVEQNSEIDNTDVNILFLRDQAVQCYGLADFVIELEQ